MPRRSAISNTVRMPGVLTCMPGELARMPRRSTDSRTRDHAWGADVYAWGAGAHASPVGGFGRGVDAWGTDAHASAQGAFSHTAHAWGAGAHASSQHVGTVGGRLPRPTRRSSRPPLPVRPRSLVFRRSALPIYGCRSRRGGQLNGNPLGARLRSVAMWWRGCVTRAPAGVPVLSGARARMLFRGMPTRSCATGVAPNMAFQRSGGIEAILASRSGKTVFPIYRRGTFQPPAKRQAVGRAGHEGGFRNGQLRSAAHAAALGRFAHGAHASGVGVHASALGRFGHGAHASGAGAHASAVGRFAHAAHAAAIGRFAHITTAWGTGAHAGGAGAYAWALGNLAPTAHAGGAGAHASARGQCSTGCMPGVLVRMPRRGVWGRAVVACPAQPAVPADRFARAIVAFLT